MENVGIARLGGVEARRCSCRAGGQIERNGGTADGDWPGEVAITGRSVEHHCCVDCSAGCTGVSSVFVRCAGVAVENADRVNMQAGVALLYFAHAQIDRVRGDEHRSRGRTQRRRQRRGELDEVGESYSAQGRQNRIKYSARRSEVLGIAAGCSMEEDNRVG